MADVNRHASGATRGGRSCPGEPRSARVPRRPKRYSPRQIERALARHDLRVADVDVGPGMRLRIAEVEDAYALLDRMIAQESLKHRVERFPYWAEVWPSSVALGRWFVAAGLPRPPAPVLELGCGLGVAGIALARLGWRVEATDFVEDALLFAAHNARLNQVQDRHHVGYLDWSNPVGQPSPCLIASDVAYERKNHRYLLRVLRALLEPGGRFYMSDPGRRPAAQLVDMLRNKGYGHGAHAVTQRWKSTEHSVTVHVFTKPC